MSDLATVHQKLKEENEKTIEVLNRDLSRIRAGKASPALLESIRVSAYGQSSPINQIGSISAPDPRSLVIAPWDQSLLPEIEKAINQSDLGLNPQNDGKVIRLNVPALTEERRKELVKMVSKTGEESKVSIRQHRKEANEEIKELEKKKVLSEDDSRREQDKVQKTVDEQTKKIDEIVEKKTQDIMTV